MEKKPTVLERVAGSPLTTGAATIFAAAAGTPLAALLPVLTTSLAGRRQQERIEASLQQISLVLEKHSNELQRLSDEQYHLLVEAISAVFQTINPEKLKYLQAAVKNSLSIEGLVAQEAAVLARIVRDISADEANFVVQNFSYKYIHESAGQSDQSDTLRIPRNSKESLIVTGLESIGVLEFGMSTIGGANKLRFSASTGKLVTLLSR